MAKPNFIELPTGDVFPILYEDRSVLAIDKPAGWMLVPFSWQKTSRNLQAALTSSIGAGDFWARSRGIKFLRFIHRLDAETSGILLFGKSPGALRSVGALFESRRMEKVYLAVVEGEPKQKEWLCRLSIGPDEEVIGKMRAGVMSGKAAETQFRVLETRHGKTLIEAHPWTGRTHQIRVHLASAGTPVYGDELYGRKPLRRDESMGLRAIELAYADPFTGRPVRIKAPVEAFLKAQGFGPEGESSQPPAGEVTPRKPDDPRPRAGAGPNPRRPGESKPPGDRGRSHRNR